MSTFRCKRFPEGEIPIRTELGLVVFTDGLAEVDDPETADALRAVPPSFQISEEDTGEEPPPAAPTRPAKTAPKPDHVAWAVHNGMDQADAEALTVKQLIAQFGG